MKKDPLEYVLNRMEAERDKPPPTLGYPAARKELLDGIAALRDEAERLRRILSKEYERIDKIIETLNSVVDHRDKLREAVEWALGEKGDFPPRGEGQGKYWWRKELRRRAGKEG